jgi:hypothetical protein
MIGNDQEDESSVKNQDASIKKLIKQAMVQEPLFWDGNFDIASNPKLLSLDVIKPQFASTLNSIWHSRLPAIHWSNIVRNRYYVCYGASYMGIWVACAIWSSPVNQNFDIVKTLELRRMAISELCPKNTATNLISRMIKDIDKRLPLVTKLISYQDTEVHLGTIYKASNWFIDAETKFNTWGKSRKRAADQSKADKIRWGYIINKRP